MTTFESYLTTIADAIRQKKGTTEPINAKNFASEILSIQGGASLNVAYGTTPPADTSKIWLECEEPQAVDIANYLNSISQGESVYLNNSSLANPTYNNTAFVFDNGNIGVFTSDNLLKIYDENGVFVNSISLSLGSNYYVESGCYKIDNTVYFAVSYSTSSYKRAYLYKMSLDDFSISQLKLLSGNYSNPFICKYIFMREDDDDTLYLVGRGSSTYWVIKYAISQNTSVTVVGTSKGDNFWRCAQSQNSCYYNGNLYLFCGVSSEQYYYKFNLESKEWTELSNVKTYLTDKNYTYFGYYYCHCIVFDNYIYIFCGVCGSSGDTGSNKILRFNVVDETIEELTEKTVGTSNLIYASASKNNIAYLFTQSKIQKYTYKQTLEQNKAVITTDTLYNNNVQLIASDKLNLSVNFHNAYKGNANNLAEKVNAYYWNGTKWKGINCEDYTEK